MVDMEKVKVVLHGQLISVLIAGTGIFATFLSTTHPSSNYPTLMNLMNYVLMSTFLCFLRADRYRINSDATINSHEAVSTDISPVFTPIDNRDSYLVDEAQPVVSKAASAYHVYRDDYDEFEEKYLTDRSDEVKRRKLFGWYFLAAVLDLEANYLVINAYNYTTITSVMLLDCFTIPSAMCLSYFFLSYRYRTTHFVGAGLCIVGLGLIVLSDTWHNTGSEASNPLLGDVFCLCGAFLYACSNVLQEHLVKSYGRTRYIGFVGAFGIILAAIQFSALDLPRLLKNKLAPSSVGYIFGFVCCLFGMYVNTSIFLTTGDATLFNLSLLTSDVYAVVFSYFMYGTLVQWLYFVAFALVSCGIAIYHRGEGPSAAVSMVGSSTLESK